MLSPQELKAVDNFRFEHRMPSRAAAVRELLRHGIASVGAVLKTPGLNLETTGSLKHPKGWEIPDQGVKVGKAVLHPGT